MSDVVGAASKAEKDGSDGDTDSQLLFTTPLLSAECKHASIKESPSMVSVVNEGTDQVLEGSLIEKRGQRTPGNCGRRFELLGNSARSSG